MDKRGAKYNRKEAIKRKEIVAVIQIHSKIGESIGKATIGVTQQKGTKC